MQIAAICIGHSAHFRYSAGGCCAALPGLGPRACGAIVESRLLLLGLNVNGAALAAGVVEDGAAEVVGAHPREVVAEPPLRD